MRKIFYVISTIVSSLAMILVVNSINTTKEIGAELLSSTNYVIDDANTFSTTELSSLNQLCSTYTNEYSIYTYVLTYSGVIYESDAIRNSESFIYSRHGNDTVDAIVIVAGVSSTSGGSYIGVECFGKISTYISNNDAYNLTGGEVFSNLKQGNWHTGIEMLINDSYSHIDTKMLMYSILPHAIIGVIAIVVTIGLVVSLVSSRGSRITVSHNTYNEPGSAQVLGGYDRYITTTRTKVRIQSSSGGSGGGGSRGGGRSGGGRSF
ncbi:MAG: TPM domain-containing protein [bacterium]